MSRTLNFHGLDKFIENVPTSDYAFIENKIVLKALYEAMVLNQLSCCEETNVKITYISGGSSFQIGGILRTQKQHLTNGGLVAWIKLVSNNGLRSTLIGLLDIRLVELLDEEDD